MKQLEAISDLCERARDNSTRQNQVRTIKERQKTQNKIFVYCKTKLDSSTALMFRKNSDDSDDDYSNIFYVNLEIL
jgi:hypothetical protein